MEDQNRKLAEAEFLNQEDPDALYRRLGEDTQVNGEPRGLVYIGQDIMDALDHHGTNVEEVINFILRDYLGLR